MRSPVRTHIERHEHPEIEMMLVAQPTVGLLEVDIGLLHIATPEQSDADVEARHDLSKLIAQAVFERGILIAISAVVDDDGVGLSESGSTNLLGVEALVHADGAFAEIASEWTDVEV